MNIQSMKLLDFGGKLEVWCAIVLQKAAIAFSAVGTSKL